jgi:hypothetical protein
MELIPPFVGADDCCAEGAITDRNKKSTKTVVCLKRIGAVSSAMNAINILRNPGG